MQECYFIKVNVGSKIDSNIIFAKETQDKSIATSPKHALRVNVGDSGTIIMS